MSDLDVSKSSFYACIERENEELKNKITKLKKQINDLEFKYEILGKQYKKILQLAKQSADSYEYCLRDTEQLYEKAITKLKENGLYNAEEFEVEEE